MNARSIALLAAVAILAGAVARPVAARAETCSLELKRLEGGPSVALGPGSDYIYRATYPQGFFMQISDQEGGPSHNPSAEAFARIVKKEPAKYNARHPYRGVATLGGHEFAFVLDAAKPEPEPEAKPEKPKSAPDASAPTRVLPTPYARLYFDFNRNGDLTDDKPVEAVESPFAGRSGPSFPRIDLTLDAGGTRFEYSFSLRAYAYGSEQFRYVSGQINSAAYREGKITLNGKQRRLVLIDFNSNGRFDDAFKVRDVVAPDGRVYPEFGDVLLVDPDPADPRGMMGIYDLAPATSRYPVASLVYLDGRYYDLEITPAGDKLTMTASSAPLGSVSNPNEGFGAVVYGDRGFVKITGGKGEPTPLPVGKWKLLAYTIDHTGYDPPPKPKDDAKKEGGGSLLESLASALMGAAGSSVPEVPRPRFTFVSAQATRDYPAIEVREGETAKLPFGPPYRPVVTVSYPEGEGKVSLAMNVVGSVGEHCTDLYVDGGRPKAPEFTIVGPDGKEVDRGKFEYG